MRLMHGGVVLENCPVRHRRRRNELGQVSVKLVPSQGSILPKPCKAIDANEVCEVIDEMDVPAITPP
jgi:hypothetical protein